MSKRGRPIIPRLFLSLFAITFVLINHSLSPAQVFPPRQSQSAPAPAPLQAQPGQLGQVPISPGPPMGGPPGSLSKTIPFVAILGDPTKAFMQIGNMRSATDTNFLLGRGLSGRIAIEKFIHEAGNGSSVVLHVNGLSNPPIVSTEGPELRLQFLIPTLAFKTYYKDYSAEGDSKLGDVMAEKVTVDVFVKPVVDQRKFPTIHSIRVVMKGNVKEPEKCTYFFDVIFPVNVCKLAEKYLEQIKPALENGIREVLLQPQTRMQFEQQVFRFVRAELLAQAGLNPNSPAQVQILEASLRGTDYVAYYSARP